jgi:hypothetical protein
MIFWSCASAGSDAQRPAGTIDHDKLTGTWQIMTSKNLKTGEVDSTFKRRLLWTQYTRSHWTYIYADSGRSEPAAAEFAKMTPDARRKANYAKMFTTTAPAGGATGGWRFWSSGGNYWLDGNTFYYTNLLSIEPSQVEFGGIEQIISVNDSAYVYHSVPRDSTQPVREVTHRRLDHGVAPRGQETTPSGLIIGNWQIMWRRDGKTGIMENVAIKKAEWVHVTENHWIHLWMTKDRKNVIPDDLAKLPAAQQVKERYAKIWDEKDQPVFDANAGTYRIENGKIIVAPMAFSLSPSLVGTGAHEIEIVTLDRHTFVARVASGPDKGTEETLRRID